MLRGVEKRLGEENAALSKERAHLSDLMRNLQTLQNELERNITIKLGYANAKVRSSSRSLPHQARRC